MKNEKHLMTKMMMNDCEEIKQAQKIILECDAVLITTGAGIGRVNAILGTTGC